MRSAGRRQFDRFAASGVFEPSCQGAMAESIFCASGKKKPGSAGPRGRLLNSARDRAAVACDYRGRVLRGKELCAVFVGETGDSAEHDDRGCSGRQQRDSSR